MTAEQLKEVENLAYAYMSKTEIGIILDISWGESVAFDRAFQTGRLKRKAEYNLRIIKLSDQLSSPAMALEAKLQEQANLEDLK